MQLPNSGAERRRSKRKYKLHHLDDGPFNNTNHLLSAQTTNNSANGSECSDNNVISEVYDDAKNHLEKVVEYSKGVVR